jgi:hypothetical protein
MNHDDYREQVILMTYRELERSELRDLEEHLRECQECREMLGELEQMQEVLEESSPEAPEHLLWQSRERLKASLHRKLSGSGSEAEGWSERLKALVQNRLMPVQAAGALAMLCLGVMIGYIAFTPSDPGGLQLAGFDPFASGNIKINSVSFETTDVAGGEVELAFQASRPFRIRGNVDDPRIQRLLAYALINEQNPGTRLRAVSTIGAQSSAEDTDLEIQAALIGALKTDDNPAVRQQALSALAKHPITKEIKEAVLGVLAYDQNAKLRIEAINVLEAAVTAGHDIESDVINALEDRIQKDDNNFIRLRAQAVLQNAGYERF